VRRGLLHETMFVLCRCGTLAHSTAFGLITLRARGDTSKTSYKPRDKNKHNKLIVAILRLIQPIEPMFASGE